MPIEKINVSPSEAYTMAKAIDRPVPELEPTIAQSAYYSYLYAVCVLKGRFPEGEAAIAKSASDSYLYAKNILKGRFPEGEAAIAKSAWYSYFYAQDILNKKFDTDEEAQEYMRQLVENK